MLILVRRERDVVLMCCIALSTNHPLLNPTKCQNTRLLLTVNAGVNNYCVVLSSVAGGPEASFVSDPSPFVCAREPFSLSFP